jgi:septum formation protein
MSSKTILASTSKYRGALLGRICQDFAQEAPICDETPLAGELPEALARRLAQTKARSIASQHPAAVVIGSDQVASLAGKILGKPGNHATAVAQLSACSGHTVDFYTAVCIRRETDNTELVHIDHTRVSFKTLSAELIENYLQAEKPYDCAGSFKSEGLGVVLFNNIESKDPTGLIGLPLIWVANALMRSGVKLLSSK